eukprot:CAMPEP_0180184760 /NCGR_PEP_ID=MMETSP0986-20121125/42008_1 /TAXON_ID=697907 /ORGANISM="non described non described, Strain CCMP2293" /LENGTH=75 /DNA_ID=CAMNT_0022138491 /DNA_START=445 /DNA_END=669 /DNA_ORIENTATION=+
MRRDACFCSPMWCPKSISRMGSNARNFLTNESPSASELRRFAIAHAARSCMFGFEDWTSERRQRSPFFRSAASPE